MNLSTEELETQELKPETLGTAIQSIRTNGYVLFEGVLPDEQVSDLHSSFIDVLDKYTAENKPNRGPNRYQMHLPFREPFNDPLVITNPFVIPLIDKLLGEDCVCHYFASDTPFPGSEHQKVHSDITQLFPESEVALPAYSIVLNIPLVEFREDNGALEIWPGGTHLSPPGENLEEMAGKMHSELALMPAGSLLVRDMRMWHRGTPNRSEAPRPNIAFIYSRHWLRTNYPPIRIPKKIYEGLPEKGRQLFRFENIQGD